MEDPTYIKKDIEANPVWELAFAVSEMTNDNAPLGWGKNIVLAENLLAYFDIKRKK